jgi:hypothetical protein
MPCSWLKRTHLAGLLVGLLAAMPGPGRADPPMATLSLDQLQRLCPSELEALYTQADIGTPPIGCTRGRVLSLADTRLPRVKACAFNLTWKGKCFEADGAFINRWPGFKALSSRAEPGASWYDGRPSLVMEYAPGTPLFANLHDEIREVAPGLYLGRLYERCPCPRFVGYFALERQCGR